MAFNYWTFSTLIHKNCPVVPSHYLSFPFWAHAFNLLTHLLTCFAYLPPMFLDCWWTYLAPWKVCSWLPLLLFRVWFAFVSLFSLVKQFCGCWGSTATLGATEAGPLQGSTIHVSWMQLHLHFPQFSPKHTAEKQCIPVVRAQTQEPRCATSGKHFHVFTC